MKIILTKFVKDLGIEGDIIDVSDGYAINSLFPRGLAKQATADIINKQKMAEKSAFIKEEKERNHIISILDKIDNKSVIFKERLNSNGNLYHSLSIKEIIRSIKEQYGIDIKNSLFNGKYVFKESGKYTVELEAYNKKIKVFVVIEGK